LEKSSLFNAQWSVAVRNGVRIGFFGLGIPEIDEKPLARPLRIYKYLMPGISVPALREAANLSGRDSIFCDRAG